MIARDLTLSGLYATRDRLGDLIVRWSPDAGGGGVAPPMGRGRMPESLDEPAARQGQAESLEQLLLARDQVSAAINAVIGAAFADIPSPELVAAARELSATTAQLRALGDSIARVNEVLKHVDQVIRLASKVIALGA